MPDDAPLPLAALLDALPYLRRHARAMAGSRTVGDARVAAALPAMLAAAAPADVSPRVAAFCLLMRVRPATAHAVLSGDTSPAARRLARLDTAPRAALLLSALDGFTHPEIAAILGISPGSVQALIAESHVQMADALTASVLIVEDDRLLARDLAALVEGMGHRIAGLARTRAEAVARGARATLILADVQLADGSSGPQAVADLIALGGPRPAVFLTAYPERLLTGGTAPEPAFVLAKPAEGQALRAALSQAAIVADPAP
ncbi:MAG: response regulator [Rhodobacteraceae bacterium]|jgi:CheY-like chemotaxis protein|nr:response regulator [Paracoccaceae bacterium]